MSFGVGGRYERGSSSSEESGRRTPVWGQEQAGGQGDFLRWLQGQIGQGLPRVLGESMDPFQRQATGGYSDFLTQLNDMLGGTRQAQQGVGDALGRLGGAYESGMGSLDRARGVSQRGLTGAEMGIDVMNRFMPGFERMAGQGVGGMSDIIQRLSSMDGGGGGGGGGAFHSGLLQDLINRGMGVQPDALLGDVTGSLRGMMETGQPVSAGPAFDAMRQVMQRGLGDQLAAQQEQYGTSGRFSSASQQSAERLRERGQESENALLGQLTMQSEEAARQRQLAAGGILGGIGQFQSTLPLQALSTVSPLAQTLSSAGLQGQDQLIRALMGAGQMRLGEAGTQLEAGRAGTGAALGAVSSYAPFIDMMRQTEMAGSRLPTDLISAQLPFLQAQGRMPMDMAGLMSSIFGQAGQYGMGQTGQRTDDILRSLPQMNPALAYMISAMFGTPLGGEQTSGSQRGRTSGWRISGGAGQS